MFLLGAFLVSFVLSLMFLDHSTLIHARVERPSHLRGVGAVLVVLYE